MKNTKWLTLSALVFGMDWFSKVAIMHFFDLYESKGLVSFFSLTYVHNLGAAFSFLEGHRWLLVVVALVMCGALVALLLTLKEKGWMTHCSYALIIGGAVGNLFDRISRGYVVDFLHFHVGDWSFPVFNVADVAISCGAVLLILGTIFTASQKP